MIFNYFFFLFTLLFDGIIYHIIPIPFSSFFPLVSISSIMKISVFCQFWFCPRYFFVILFRVYFNFSIIHALEPTHKFHSLKEFTLSFSLFNYFNRGLMTHTTTTTPTTMTRHTFNSNHSNNPMISSPLFSRKTLDASAIPISPRFSRRPFPNKASPGL